MTSDDPRRLFENEDAPVELRRLLVRAHEDAIPQPVVEDLIRNAQRQARPGHIRLLKCASWAKRTSRHARKLLLALVAIGAGTAAWHWRPWRAQGGDAPDVRPSTEAAEPGATLAQAAVPPVPPDPAIAPAPALEVTSAQPHGPAAGPGQRPVREATGSPGTASDHGSVDSDEFRLLRTARQVLARDPRLTLHLTDQHLRRFPHGLLAQEREALAIEALLALGREDQAKARARAFLASYPSSPHRKRAERVLVPASPAP